MALLAFGRFVMFFARSESATSALGLAAAQWTSIGLLLIAAAGVDGQDQRSQPSRNAVMV
jgi:hypothetical protein